MSVSFYPTMDSKSREVRRDDKVIGHILWHEDRPRWVGTSSAFAELSLSELKSIVAELDRLRRF